MQNTTDPTPSSAAVPGLPAATSDLSNLLQIISHATFMLENAEGEAAREYREILRQTLGRAETLAAQLASSAGGASQVSARKPTPDKDEAAPRARSILLVDDELAALVLSKKLLGDAGFSVTTAESGFAAVDLFRRTPFAFDLVLLDLNMPFMDGEETFRRLREIRGDVAVILSTGFIQQERLDRLSTIGIAGFLRKPVGANELVAFVRSTLAGLMYSGSGSDSGLPVAI